MGQGSKGATAGLSKQSWMRVLTLAAAAVIGLVLSPISAATGQGYPRPQGATPLRISLVPAFERCNDPNTRHAAPLAFDACNPPRPLSREVTVGTPNLNGAAAQSAGHLRIGVIAGNPATPADEADLGLVLEITDVRHSGSLSDYDGELRTVATLRVTDNLSGTAESDDATVADFLLEFDSACAATGAETLGATCATHTTAEALIPGFMREGGRSVVKVGEVQVWDGGPDRDTETDPNHVFAWQGIFLP